MRIPISDNEIGYWRKNQDGSCYFISEEHIYSSWDRKGTWAEFKELYPYRSSYIRHRYKVCVKNIRRWNKIDV